MFRGFARFVAVAARQLRRGGADPVERNLDQAPTRRVGVCQVSGLDEDRASRRLEALHRAFREQG